MMHRNRRWSVVPATCPEMLAHDLTEHTWCGCNGWELAGYWFLNDATSADGAQEYGIVKIAGPRGKPVQIESITFSWCDYEKALRHVRAAIAGKFDASEFRHEVAPVVETPEQHGRCHLCM